MTLAAAMFGWPAVAASLLVTSVGLARKRWTVVLAGAAIAAPFMVYLMATPRFESVAPPVALMHLAAAVAVARRHWWLAVALFAPFVALAGYAAFLVARQVHG